MNFLLGQIGKKQKQKQSDKNGGKTVIAKNSYNAKKIEQDKNLNSSHKQNQKSKSNSMLKKQERLESSSQIIFKNNTTKKSITNQIDKLMNKINDTNQNIKQTQQLLDIDLFLKTQKQKRLEYAKNLNSNYQIQKKKREQKLYKKHNRQERNQEINVHKKINQKSGIKKKVGIPLDIMKIFNFNSSSKLSSLSILQQGNIKTILNGHHYNFGFGNQLQKTIQQGKLSQQGIINKFQTLIMLSKNNLNKKSYDDTNLVLQSQSKYKKIVQIAKNSSQINIFSPIKIPQSSLLPFSESQNLMNALVFLLINQQFADNHYLQSSTKNNSSKLLLCKFYDYGIRRSILTNATIEVRQFTHKDVIIGSRMHNKDIFWPAIIQKAYRLMKFPYGIRNFSNITLNQSIYDIFGLDAQIIPLSNKNLIFDNFPKILYSLLMDNCMIGFLNSQIQNNIYQNRVYLLLSVQNKTIKKKEIEFQFRLYDPWYGKVLSSENKNIFKTLQLCQLFDRIVIIRNYPAKWKHLRIKVSFFSNGAINSLNNQWTKNSQYLFTITKNSLKMRIVLRKIRDRQQKSNQQSSSQDGFYGFLLFKNPQYLTHVTCMKIQNLITKVKSTDINGTSYFTQLQKGNYILVPFTNNPSQKEYKFFYLEFFIQKQQGINFGKAKLTDYFFSNIQSEDKDGNTKVIQQMKTQDKFQKPKVQIINLPEIYKTEKNLIENTQRRAKGLSDVQTPKINLQYLESLNITLFKNVKLDDIYLPGNISSLLINKQVPIETQRTNKKKLKKENQRKSKNQQNKQNLNQNQNVNIQLTQCQKQQNLKIILGYDAMSQEINRGQMKQLILDHDDQIDLANFQLGSQGLIAIMQSLMQKPCIQKINLQNNLLTDQGITFLCYYLEKSNRVELRLLDLRRNPMIGKMGFNALNGLAERFQNLEIKTNDQKSKKKKDIK